MRDCPCHFCRKHSEICHAQCKEYPAWVAELAEERRQEREDRRRGRAHGGGDRAQF